MTNTTQTQLISRDERRTFDAAWIAYVGTGKATAPAFILQAILRGRDPKRGFSPITNGTKLANGQTAWQGYRQALGELRWRLGSYVADVWPDLMGNGLGPNRYETLVADLAKTIDLLKKEA